MKIIDLKPENGQAIDQAAALLYEGFKENWPDAWPTMAAARQEVEDSMGPGKLSRVAVEADGVVGWVGGIAHYQGHVWEVHPLVVRNDRRNKGIGRRLLEDLEAQVKQRGGLTLWLGTEDESAMTTLANVDLYPDPLQKLMAIGNLKGHPYEFYLKCGFVLSGVVPDANGIGKPDITMSKRVA